MTPLEGPSAPPPGPKGRRYWRSLEELAQTPEFRALLEREFPPGASELFRGSRRRFLTLMGASLGLAGLTGCIRWPETKLAPYAHRPNHRTPGVPVRYATAMEIGGIAQGLLVTSYDGRPIKIEGNPSHPLNRGAADAIAQASVLEVYDPDRSRGVILREGGQPRAAEWEQFARWARPRFTGDGAGICVLSEVSSSPSLADLRARFQKAMPKAQWFEYEPVSDDAVREGARRALGTPMRTVLELSQARVVVALDADLFGDGNPLGIKYARDFAAGRRLHDTASSPMNRLYVVESIHTITGACADHRRALRSSAISAFAARLAAALGLPASTAPATAQDEIDGKFVETLTADLQANAGRSVVVAGPRQPPEVHALIASINDKLGNNGKTVLYYPDPEPRRPSHAEALRTLVGKIHDRTVSTLLILGGNPVYNAPADLKFAEAIPNVENTIHLAIFDDETSRLCTWHLSRAHYLESWGDARTCDGTVSIVAPLIEPLFDGRSAIEVLAMISGDNASSDGGYEIVRRTFRSLLGAGFTEWKWKKALADGVVEGTAYKPAEPGKRSATPETSKQFAAEIASPAPSAKDGYEVVFYTDAKVYDGRLSNNGWLQELPDPMTRLTWDNAALMNPRTAETIGVARDELVELSAEGAPNVEAPAFFLPGMPDGVIALALGYGRTAAGNVGDGVGHDAYALRTSSHSGWRTGVKARATGRIYPLATVQDHHIIDAVGRKGIQQRIPELIHEATLAEFQQDPSMGYKTPPAVSIFNEHRFDGRAEDGTDRSHVPAHDFHRWGMAIDLTTCTGCSACVVACQAENNIPIVGKQQVLHGREMHWIRIDRYFRETPENPVAAYQPVLCMHCETAPCEEVCPVAATTHSQEGINMMTYNRCVGTRYCSNNCPYKVRRFNFFDYNRGTLKDLYVPNLVREPISELLKMQKNPEVTVRMRGVMEKCTYCIQRIEAARIEARRQGDRALADGEIRTACQQTCPADAIAFGDLNDPGSRVSKLQKLARTYAMLDPELHTKPRTQYVAKVRNPAPGLDESQGRET